jgi:release factor glutamine methyltransferase
VLCAFVLDFPVFFPKMINVRTALKNGIARLREAYVSSYTLAAEVLLLHVLGRNRTWLYAHPEEEISEADAQEFSALLDRRAAGEPTQHLTGKQEFWGLEFEVNPDVLIPRPETEHVVEVALDRLGLREISRGRPQTTKGEGLQIADIGTGSGCIAIALAKVLPAAMIYATDISPKALAVAQRNAARLDLADRIHFIESNLFDRWSTLVAQHAAPRQGKRPKADTQSSATPGLSTADHRLPVTSHQSALFDLIVSNPPYIGRCEADTLAREVREHEPEMALYGGEEGYEFYADLIAEAAKYLKPGGILVLELGHNSLPAVQPLLETADWTHVGVTNDLAGIPRVIAAEHAATPS